MEHPDLTGVSYPSSNGVDRLIIEQCYGATHLLQLLRDEWLPYIECHKCGRWKSCPYGAEPHPANPHRSLDKQCGVAERCLKIFLDAGLPLLVEGDQQVKEGFLEAAYHLTRYVARSERITGDFLDDDIVRWYGENVPLMVSSLKSLRQHLDGLCASLRSIPHFHSTQSILLVEGESELRFLRRMMTSSMAAFMFKQYDTYSGSGNRRKQRIEMLLRHYHLQGYNVHLQIDGDGKDTGTIKATTASNFGLPIDRVFVFSRDFESSVPFPLAADVLATVVGQPEEKVRQVAEGLGAAVNLKDLLGGVAPEVELDDIKVEFAHALGDRLAKHYLWHTDDTFIATELGRFLQFVAHA